MRSEKLASLSQPFDILVIGGGATGLGIAVDAATRGYRTALVETGDFAQATSSRATKLVHGGVRYLASGQIHLVYEALHERAVMLRNAPHLVEPLGFVLPAQSWIDLPFYGIGLKIYDLLSGSASMGPTSILSQKETKKKIPNIAADKLRGGIFYHDGQFDDARLALALARTAEDHDATVLNYVRSTSFLKENGKITGAVVQDVETGTEYSVHAKCVINATGIFVDDLRKEDDHAIPKLLSVSRGTHIVVDPEVLGSHNAIMVPKTEDGRVIFAIPWLGKVVIGTTDLAATDVEMEPGHIASEIEYLLEHINPYLTKQISHSDILSVFSGLRPLVTGKSSTTSKLSREHHIDTSPTGLITVAGGKWTTYRRMAEDTLTFAIKHNMLPDKPCRTRDIKLHAAPTVKLPGPLARYGDDASEITKLVASRPDLFDPVVPNSSFDFILAEVVFAVRHEMARTVEDVLSRRMRLLLLDAKAASAAAPSVAALMARELNALGHWEQQQVTAFQHLATTFYIANPT